MKAKPKADELPPHSDEMEQALIGCLLHAVKETMEVCRKTLTKEGEEFYDLRNREIYGTVALLYRERKPVDIATVSQSLKDRGLLDNVGGITHLAACSDAAVPSNVSYYLEVLREKFAIRRALQAGAALAQGIHAASADMEKIRAVVGETVEVLKGVNSADEARPLVRFVTVNEILQYEPDPTTYLVGEQMIRRREFSILAGVPSAGKSMLANTLAIAGARGTGSWMGYEIKRPFRTLILQSEGSFERLKAEFAGLPKSITDSIRISEMGAFEFWNPAYRTALREYAELWPYDLLLLDNWSDVVPDDKRADHQMAFDWLRQSLPSGDLMPGVLIIAHLTKAVLKADRPMTGRAMMAHVTGSMRIVEKARTQFTLQPVNNDDVNDPRVIFDCAKASNAQTVHPRGCYIRKPQCFEFVPHFDFEEWLAGDANERKTITAQTMEAVFEGRSMTRKRAAEALEALGFARVTAYKALQADGRFSAQLREEGGLLSWGEA